MVYRSLTVGSEGKAAAIQQTRENTIGQVSRRQRNLVLAAICRAHRGVEVDADIAAQVNTRLCGITVVPSLFANRTSLLVTLIGSP